jgi:O-antigen ligase
MAFAHTAPRTSLQPVDAGPALMVLALMAALVIALGLAVDAILLLILVFGTAVLCATVAWPRLGIALLMLMVVLGDVRLRDPNFATFGRAFAPVQGLNVTPIELMLGSITLGLLVRLLFDARVRLHVGELFLPIMLLLVGIAGGIAIGLQRGADMEILRAETRNFFYLPLIYLSIVHFVTTRRQMHQLFWLFIVAVNVMAAEDVYRYYVHVRGDYQLTAAYDLAFAHEDALFCAVAVIMLLSRLVWTRSLLGEWKSVLLMVLPLAALLVMRRRAGMVALDAGLILLCLVLLKDNVRMFLIVVPLALVGVGLLLMLTWNEPGGTGQFARSIQTISGQETATASRDNSSDNYRAFEQKNVEINIKSQPLTGLGFGRPYAFYLPLNDLSFWQLWRYVPHNTVLWVWMKAGLFAFAALLALFAVALTRAMQLTNGMRADSLKPLAFGFGAAVLMFVLYSWVDLGLVSPRAMILFGITLGGIGAISRIVTPTALRGEAA